MNAAFADPGIRAILATIGGDDQILVVPHLDPALPVADPKPFVGYSDNTNILNWLWSLGVRGYYGGSTAVHLGTGPGVDDIHLRSLRALLLDGGSLAITEPGSRRTSGGAGTIRALSPSSATVSRPRSGRGPVLRSAWRGAPGAVASRWSTDSRSPIACPRLKS